jgi:hypothetical protein
MRPSKVSALATLLGGGAFAMTLMACYGVPPGTYDYEPGDARVPADPSVSDGDAAADAKRDAESDGGRDAQSDADDAGDAN